MFCARSGHTTHPAKLPYDWTPTEHIRCSPFAGEGSRWTGHRAGSGWPRSRGARTPGRSCTRGSPTASPAPKRGSGPGATWRACSSGWSARTAGSSRRRSGEAGPRGVQRLLSAATWDADGVRDDLRDYVVDAPRRRGDRRAHRRRDRLPEEGEEVLRRGAPIHRHGRRHRELPGRRLPGLRLGRRRGLHRPRPVPAAGMDGRPGPPDRSGRPRGDPLRHQDRAGAADARAGVRRGRPRALGRRPMPSTAGRTRCGGGSRSAGAPTR